MGKTTKKSWSKNQKVLFNTFDLKKLLFNKLDTGIRKLLNNILLKVNIAKVKIIIIGTINQCKEEYLGIVIGAMHRYKEESFMNHLY